MRSEAVEEKRNGHCRDFQRNADDFINLMDSYIAGVGRALGILISASAARTMTRAERQVFHHVRSH